MKPSKHILFCLTFLLLLLLGGQAFATYLTIFGSSNLQISVEDGTVHIHGTYNIQNQGDEIAQNVFPSLQVGSFRWAASPKVLATKEKASWTLDESFPEDKLKCSQDDCPGQNLPLRGLFPFLVLRNYQDMNGYSFASPGVEHKVIGNLDPDSLYVTRIPPLEARLTTTGNGSDFRGTVEIRNLSSADKKVSVFCFTSPELQVLSQPAAVDVPGNSIAYHDIRIKNFNGLPGSTYIVYAILEWQEKSIRDSISASAPVSIVKVKHTLLYALSAAGALVIALLLLYYFVFRKEPA